MIYRELKPGTPAAYSPWVEVVQRAVLHGEVLCSMRPGHGLEVPFSVGFPFSSL